MPSKDTVPFRITKGTYKDLERIREVISKELGIPIKSTTYKQAEIAMRIKASRGKVFVKELRNILLGKIK